MNVFIFFVLVQSASSTVIGNPYISAAARVLSERADNLCTKQLNEYISSIASEIWALQMFDATSKLTTGITHGNMADLGDFDLCLSIQHDSQTTGTLRGKYCLGKMVLGGMGKEDQPLETFKEFYSSTNKTEKATAALSWYWSFCIPHSCTAQEGADFLNSLASVLNINLFVIGDPIRPGDGFVCQTEETVTKELDGGAIATLTIFGVILLLMMVQTGYDIYLMYAEKEPHHEMMRAFSVLSNGRKIFKVVKREDQLRCLDGMKVISMMWVVYGHRLSSTMAAFSLTNGLDILEWGNHQYSQYIVQGTLAVDTFFLIGGLLVSYNVMKATSKGIPLNIPKFYIHRYLRLSVALGAMVLISVTLLPYTNSGPFHPMYIEVVTDSCKEYWWATMLYIQNWITFLNMCVAHSWYLSVDFQLYILSPLLLIPLKKWPTPTLAVTWLLIGCSIGSCIYVAYHYSLTAIATSPLYHTNMLLESYYVRTHTRCNVWLFGLIVGYHLHEFKTKGYKVTRISALAYLGLALSLMAIAVFAGYRTLRGPEYNTAGEVMYFGFMRFAWAVGVFLIILVCLSGHGGPINAFLSMPLFQILNRLTYAIYLIHIYVVCSRDYSRRNNYFFSDINMIYASCADWICSFLLAIPWTLAFESPVIIIEKFLFEKVGNLAKKS